MDDQRVYDVAIIGGGIAGLSLAIQCANDGFQTIVLERGAYPRHKVCGEYISNESLQFISQLNIDIKRYNLPVINEFRLTDYFNNVSECALTVGGFGWSRFAFDQALHNRAVSAGAEVLTKCPVIDWRGSFDNGYTVQLKGEQSIQARMVINAAGRSAAMKQGARSVGEPWIGVKYHLASGPSPNEIEIHAFRGGYAGISQIEDGKYCLAYLCKAEGLKQCGSDIQKFESEVLSENKHLAKRLSAGRIMGPITTSQFYFGIMSEANNAIGDAAGFIPPLTGNGMSLALRASKNTYHYLSKLLDGEMDEAQFQKEISLYVKGYLKKRVNRGILLQNLLFLKPELLNRAMMKAFSLSPFALRTMTKMAVGETI